MVYFSKFLDQYIMLDGYQPSQHREYLEIALGLPIGFLGVSL